MIASRVCTSLFSHVIIELWTWAFLFAAALYHIHLLPQSKAPTREILADVVARERFCATWGFHRQKPLSVQSSGSASPMSFSLVMWQRTEIRT